ncbi:MAG: SpoIID/LytB domain-containing protein [Chloroflexota bacterium]
MQTRFTSRIFIPSSVILSPLLMLMCLLSYANLASAAIVPNGANEMNQSQPLATDLSSLSVGETPHHAYLQFAEQPIIDRPGYHLGRPQLSPDGQFLAVALIPTGSETASRAHIQLIDLYQGAIVDQKPGYAVKWVAMANASQASSAQVTQLDIQQLLTDGSVLTTRHELKQAQRPLYSAPFGNPNLLSPVEAMENSGFQSDRIIAQETASAANQSWSVQISEPLSQSKQTSEIQNSPNNLSRNQSQIDGSPIYPEVIRVLHHAQNNCRNVDVGQVAVIPFEEYVARVLPAEVPAFWAPAALEAQAIAIRTYAWYQIQIGRATYDVSDFANFQMMCDARYPATDAAANVTAGLYLSSQNDEAFRPLIAMYSAENGHPTLSNQEAPHLQSVPDLFSVGRERYGHGYGLSQWGAQRRAIAGFTTGQILDHYYTNIYLRNGLAPDQTVASLSYPPGQGLLRTSSLRWQLLTSGSDQWESQSTETELSGQDGNSVPTIRITASPATAVTSEAESDKGPWRFQQPSGIWSLPDYLTDGDMITVELELDGSILEQSILTIDRQAPQIPQITVPQFTNNTQATLQIQSPKILPIGVNLDWNWSGESLFHTSESGHATTDPMAVGGQSWQGMAGQHKAGVWYGPYTTDVQSGMSYRVLFWLRAPQPMSQTLSILEEKAGLYPDEVIARLDVADDEGRVILGFHDIRYSDLVMDSYTPIPVDFYLPAPPKGLEFRVAWRGEHSLFLDEVQLWTYPEVVDDGEIVLNMKQRVGGQLLSVAAFDQAGNVGVYSTSVTDQDKVPPNISPVNTPTSLPSGNLLKVTFRAADRFSGIDPNQSWLHLQREGDPSTELLPGTIPITGTTSLPPAIDPSPTETSIVLSTTATLDFPENPWVEQSLSFEIADLSDGIYTAQVVVADHAGNQSRSASWSLLVAEDPTYRIWLPIGHQ